MSTADTLEAACRAAFMAGFEKSSARLNGDTLINGEQRSDLVSEYLGLESAFANWYAKGTWGE